MDLNGYYRFIFLFNSFTKINSRKFVKFILAVFSSGKSKRVELWCGVHTMRSESYKRDEQRPKQQKHFAKVKSG